MKKKTFFRPKKKDRVLYRKWKLQIPLSYVSNMRHVPFEHGIFKTGYICGVENGGSFLRSRPSLASTHLPLFHSASFYAFYFRFHYFTFALRSAFSVLYSVICIYTNNVPYMHTNELSLILMHSHMAKHT